MIKKILASTALVAAISAGTAFAEDKTGNFYGKVQAGGSYLAQQKVKNLLVNDKENSSVNLKSEFAPIAGLAVGYYVQDNVRVELAIDHLFNPNMKTKQFTVLNSSLAGKVGSKLELKNQITTALLSAYVDVFDYENVKFHVGAGLGAASVKSKMKVSRFLDGKLDKSTEYKAKQKTNLAYLVGAGVSYEVTSGIHAELGYNFRGYGKVDEKKLKNKEKESFDSEKSSSYDLMGHNVVAGVRFDF